MTDTMGRQPNVICRQARKRFDALDEHNNALTELSVTERAATNRHVQTCSRCALEYRLFVLQRAALDAAAAPEQITPDEDFYRSLRAKIARGPDPIFTRPQQDESWTAALLITARQLVPAMAVLVLLMLGATLLWNQAPVDTNQRTNQAAVRPRERVIFPEMYDYPEPTQEDVLETLVAVEEKENGK
ncbi:MAG TPA: hypothetical protein VFF31_24140 [Blastocatellia bacterium]|nr:hypothetical protein [Blastocatellia bacterium]